MSRYLNTVSPQHDPPASCQFNKLRKAGGSKRLTLVKAAVDAAGIESSPPRPLLAHIPAGDGIWLAFDTDQFESQCERVEIRTGLSEHVSPSEQIVGEYPVFLRGKLGSSVTIVPKRLSDSVGVAVEDQITTIAVGTGMLLFLTESAASEIDIELVLERLRQELDDR